MPEDKFDVIIVGAGPAGSVTGYVCAKAGLEVLIIERGDTPGSKNMSGGRLYGHSLEKIMPGFAAQAPVQRRVTRETISMLTQDSSFSLDFQSALLSGAGHDSYTVLRAEFDQWLAAQAEEAGAVLAGNVRVDDLIYSHGRVAGVMAGPDEMAADVVVAADGVNSLLAQKAGLKKELKPGQVSVGVKEVIALPEETINDRFGLRPDEGAARLFVGEATKGRIGGGFIYTNRASLSLGLVFNLQNLIGAEQTIPDLLEAFKIHPLIEPLLAGGRTVEYAAHLVPEAGLNMLPRLYTDGFLVAGDAAGLVINLGYLIRGMDLAIASGQAAGQVIIQAHQEKDFSQNSLARYQQALENSFVLQDLRTYRSAQAFLDNPRLYAGYPQLAKAVLAEMFTVDGRPARPLLKKIWPHVRRFGLTRLLKDAWKGRRAV